MLAVILSVIYLFIYFLEPNLIDQFVVNKQSFTALNVVCRSETITDLTEKLITRK